MYSAGSCSTAWLPALTKSADQAPNHVIPLEALCSLGLLDPRSGLFVMITQLPLHYSPGGFSGPQGQRSRGNPRIGLLTRRYS
ncbi:hypothetical protein BV98_001316 [Sphingobium herbicidovorans NBRC 16415]|uniref:Uncharacterized protein n=1 Tax=Sphingobium herbicidovorans (strain ATCC 700291 / DSM 11019 / CCUG 56400 / KCTC 2939 / LMG 18315 / NBRC 16415 / MH) TaxID=1219045 RepID=A0A086PC31_SPHHM|nr:hypothetical protein BV98_001316 [Sphingobium herbicidovorans NBRC 16415]